MRENSSALLSRYMGRLQADTLIRSALTKARITSTSWSTEESSRLFQELQTSIHRHISDPEILRQCIQELAALILGQSKKAEGGPDHCQ